MRASSSSFGPKSACRRGSWKRHVVALAALAAGVCATEGTSLAGGSTIPDTNGNGFDTHLFRPALDSKGFFATNGSDILGHLDFSFGLVVDYGRSLLRLDGDTAAGRTNQIISHSFQGTFSANLGLFNHVVVGVDMPVILMAGDRQSLGDPPSPSVAGWGTNSLDSQNLEFIGLHAKWRILRVERGFGLALALQGGFAVTDAPRYAGADPGGFIWPILIAEKRFGATGKLKLGLNAGFRAHPLSGTTISPLDARMFDHTGTASTLTDGDLLTYGLGLSYRATDVLDLVLDTYGSYQVAGNTSSDLALSGEATAGIKLFVDRASYFMLGGGTRYTPGYEAADMRGFVGFIFEPSIGDRDGDGYKDDVDQCPDQPEDFDGYKDEDGCPDPDNDNDGVLDVDDRCPNVPGPKETDGCPSSTDGDRDGDGILDSRDKCPDVPEDRDGFQDQDGCPDPDNDQDGIPDKKDLCPNDPEDKDGFQDQDGCPDPDNDQDGIPDTKDKCPGTDADVQANKDTKETFNNFEDDDGCPDKGSVIIQGNDIMILQKIQFKTASAEILPESNAILDAVATTLLHNPQFTLIEVAGHADERASDSYNLKLTQDRVDSVVAALVSRGVPRDRLRSKGYGEYCPADPGHNPKAWETNRRVEFKVVKTKDGPTGVELGCQNARAHGVNPDPVP